MTPQCSDENSVRASRFMTVLLLLKAKIAHQAGFYLAQGRWHKIKAGKPIPKGSPVAHSPNAAGLHKPVKLSFEQIEQLKYPADKTSVNKEMAAFNSVHLPKILAHAENGDATALLGLGFGTNTHSAKQAKIANFLLAEMGSNHTVKPGQAAGDHPAVKQVLTEPVAADPAPEPAKPEVPKSAATPTEGGPEFDDSFGKAAYYNKLAGKLKAAYDDGDLDGLVAAKGIITGAAVAGKTKNSKILIAYHDKLASDLAAKGMASEIEALAKPAPEAPKVPQTLGTLIQGEMNKMKAADKLAQVPWEAMKLPTTNTNAGTFNKKIDEIKAAAEAGDLAKLEAMTFGKNTYNLKAAKIAATAIAALKEYAPASAPSQVKPTVSPWQKKHLGAIEFDDGMTYYTAMKTDDGGYEFLTSLDSDSDPGKEFKTLPEMKQYLDAHFGDKAPSDADLSSLDAGPIDPPPQEGDIKNGADGTLTFHNGRWHKQKQVEPEPAPPATGLDAITIPDFEAISPGKHGLAYKAVAEQLLSTAKEEGVAGLKGNITKHKTGKFTIKAAGWQLKHVGPDDPTGDPITKARRAAMHKLITEIYAAAPKTKKTSKPKATAPAPNPIVGIGNIPPMDHWVQTGPQGGSNPGGRFKDDLGVEWYCKFPADEDVAKSELLASKLYAAAGVAGQDAKLVTKGGKVGIASRWTEVSKAPASILKKADGAQSGFMVDAWLGNWDVVGLEYDNLQLGADGKAVRIDAGGSLQYRAQGGKKAFGSSVIEIDSLQDKSINPQAAAVFGGMTKADISASASRVAKIADATIHFMVNAYGPGDAKAKQELAETLIARKADILAKYPKAKKEKVITFKPEKVSAPPSFVNWGGTGKSGPSSKEFLNEANEKAVQAIYEAAKTGKADAIQNLSADVFNKDTGDVTGSAKVLEHPSQHVKGYAQQAINEISYQLNPPKRFRFDGGHPLHSLNYAYPAHKGPGHSAAAGKLAKFVLLGEPGTVSIEALALPKMTYNAGTLTSQTYSKVAQDAFSKMPETQKQAVRNYTGGSYASMNNSLWEGNPSGAAKAAGEALHALGHDLLPGTVLSRKISVHGSDLDQILKSSGKILQEQAIMSTSIRPGSWSGNVQIKMHVGPGVKGLWVGKGSQQGGGAISNHSGEDEIILPPNTRLLVLSTSKANGIDADGFGGHGTHIIEAVILPTQDHA